MDLRLPPRIPVSFTTALRNGFQSKFKPFVGFLPTRSITWRMGQMIGETYPITASSGFSKRKKKKSSTSKSKDPSPKGFGPRTKVPTSTKRKDQKSNEENKGSGSSSSLPEEATDVILQKKACEESDDKSNDIVLEDSSRNGATSTKRKDQKNNEENKGSGSSSSLPKEATDVILQKKACEESDDKSNDIVLEDSSRNGALLNYKINHEGNGKFAKVDGHTTESKNVDRITKNEENVTASGAVDVLAFGRTTEENQVINGCSKNQWHENTKNESGGTHKRTNNIVNISMKLEQDESVKAVDNAKKSFSAGPASVNGHSFSTKTVDNKGDVILEPKSENQENLHNKAVHRLAEDSFKKGNKLFHYPELVKPDQQIELFFNKSFSTLKNEHDVTITGAFNKWRWKPFTIRLNKSNLNGDWWSCKIHVPREAYTIDFVFHSGNNVYDNNHEQDFCILVDGGLDEFGFENFLLEEKCWQQKEIARKKAEKKRQEEEERHKKEERLAKAADRAQAREEVSKRLGILQELMKNARISIDGIWYIEPREFTGNEMVRLYYKKSSGPLSQAKDLWIHGGYDNWKDGLSIVLKLDKSQNKDEDWWYAEFVVPDQAVVLNWVFADGAPNRAVLYDNNHHQDFCAIVPAFNPSKSYWVEEEQKVYNRLQVERHTREKAKQAKAEKTARLKAEMKERTLKSFSLSQNHVVYTDPLNVQAGSTATLFYNPANTVLNGKSEIWLRYSFNHWRHRFSSLPPQRMIPAENGSHFKAIVNVPLDAYIMDFVFSDNENGGIYDNKNGMDYHIPVSGAMKEHPMHVVHISVEMAPIAKVGGMGDVVTGISRAIQDMNHKVDIILPKYDCLNYSHVENLQFHKSYSLGSTEIKVWTGEVEDLSVYFLEPQNGLFWAGCIYGEGNDAERFGFFCQAAVEFLLQNDFHPDIIHCHDWSTAPVACLFKEHCTNNGLNNTRVVFTIHNLEFGPELIGKAMACADKSTTVSPTYAQEVSRNPVVSSHLCKFHGILNGIDQDIWDPYNDNVIPVPYTSENVVEGKRAAKDALQQKLGLERADKPLVGIITRLTQQKGIHLIKHAIWHTLERGGQVVLLGSAPDSHIQNDFVSLSNELQSSHHDRARLCLTYDEPLSHMIYAGADFILVPSIFEPCGLTQLIAMRYGSIPVVRKTGGLQDTVFDVNHDAEIARGFGLETNGYNFDGADAAGVDYALNRAISAWYNEREWLNTLCKRVMEQDWSWNKPALDYLELYYAARK